MLRNWSVVATLMAVGLAMPARGEAPAMAQHVRELDSAEARAMLAADLEELDRLWSDRLVVNAPDHVVKEKRQVLEAVRGGRIRYASFERTVERVVLDGDVAVTMGGEVVVPVGDRPDAGRRLSRRYSHVWRRVGEAWSLIARHANLVDEPPK